ncbi:hypothetical protein DIPPA_09484 [Diplonema papillatum]|nr:hypothetical protein DIPPA_09484 [Diplonema papillatum]
MLQLQSVPAMTESRSRMPVTSLAAATAEAYSGDAGLGTHTVCSPGRAVRTAEVEVGCLTENAVAKPSQRKTQSF